MHVREPRQYAAPSARYLRVSAARPLSVKPLFRFAAYLAPVSWHGLGEVMHVSQVLLAIPDGSAFAGLAERLAEAAAPRVTHAPELARAANLLLTGSFDCAFAAAGAQSAGLIRELRRSGVSTPVVALLAPDAGPSTAEQAIRAGFQDALLPGEATAVRLSAILNAASRITRAERRAAAAEARRAHQTLYHPVTGLPQAPLFFDRLDQGLELARRHRGRAAVAVVGLDGWRNVVREHGKDAADATARAVAARLRTLARRADTIAHLADGIFAVLLAPGREGGAEVAAAKMLDAARRPVLVAGEAVSIGASAGIALFPEHGEIGAALLRRADLAMRSARRTGSGVVRFAGAEPEQESPAPPPGLAAELDAAIRDGQIGLVFQPKVGMAPVEFQGVEALVRWRHPRYGVLPPESFIPAAEQTGAVAALSLHILDLALARQREWRAAGSRIPVAVNLSAVSLQDAELPETVARLLRRHGTPPGDLTLEITESAIIISDLAKAADTLDALHAQGVRIAIDDFGAGFTSLSYLGRLPVGELKLDRSFARTLEEDGEEAVILRSIIGLGRSLGLKVVAEGVESAKAWRALAGPKCHTAQGFFVSRPLELSDLLTWVRRSGWTALALATPQAS